MELACFFPAIRASVSMKGSSTMARSSLFRASIVTMSVLLMTAFSGANAQAPDPDILKVEHASGERPSTYTIEQLRNDFPQHERTTGTPWSPTGATISFHGPLLSDILAKNGLADATEVELRAYNDFVSKITSDEISRFSPILAIEQQCQDEDRTSGLCSNDQLYRPLSIDDGGPFYLVWPLKDLPPSYVPGRNSIWVWFVAVIRPVQ